MMRVTKGITLQQLKYRMSWFRDTNLVPKRKADIWAQVIRFTNQQSNILDWIWSTLE